MIVINGDFYDHNITGVQRYAYEVIEKLDELITEGELSSSDFVLLVPKDLKKLPEYRSLRVVRFGKNRRLFWQQWDLFRYCKKHRAVCLCLCTAVPFLYPERSAIVLHDAATKAHPEFYSRRFLLQNQLLLWKHAKRYRKIFTVSQFSRGEISRYSGVAAEKITVVPSSAEHMERIEADEGIFRKLPPLGEEWYFTLSSLSPNKNYRWIIREAGRNPGARFVISGMKLRPFSEEKMGEIPENVIFTGYLSDGEVKALMQKCTAFLFPTFYEGFGLTPLEAMSCGARIILSDTPCMREVYGESAIYIDPLRTDYVLSELLKEEKPAELREETLRKYSWKRDARRIAEELLSLQ